MANVGDRGLEKINHNLAAVKPRCRDFAAAKPVFEDSFDHAGEDFVRVPERRVVDFSGVG